MIVSTMNTVNDKLSIITTLAISITMATNKGFSPKTIPSTASSPVNADTNKIVISISTICP
jgi:hypothetical protein